MGGPTGEMGPTGGMEPTGGMGPTDGMVPTGGMGPTGAPGGDPSTGGPTKDYTPIFTCKGTAETQTVNDETKIVCKDNSGTIIKEAMVKCKKPQSDITSSGSGTESKVYCCPDCPPMPTMNMDFPTFDFGN